MPGQQQESQQQHTYSRCRHHLNAACLSGQKPAFIVKLTTLKCLFCYNSQRKLRCEVTPDLARCSPEHIHVQGIWEFSIITDTLVWVRILLFRLLYLGPPYFHVTVLTCRFPFYRVLFFVGAAYYTILRRPALGITFGFFPEFYLLSRWP